MLSSFIIFSHNNLALCAPRWAYQVLCAANYEALMNTENARAFLMTGCHQWQRETQIYSALDGVSAAAILLNGHPCITGHL